MKKHLFIFISLVLLIFLLPVLASAAGLVPCGGPDEDPCEISHFFQMLYRIYDFLIKWIAFPLAVLGVTIGGVLILISAGSPNLLGLGKKILYSAIIGLVLVFCSWLIINTILCTALEFCNWNVLY